MIASYLKNALWFKKCISAQLANLHPQSGIMSPTNNWDIIYGRGAGALASEICGRKCGCSRVGCSGTWALCHTRNSGASTDCPYAESCGRSGTQTASTKGRPLCYAYPLRPPPEDHHLHNIIYN